MKVSTKQVSQLTAKEVGDILCEALADKLNANGSLGIVKGGGAVDRDGLAAEVTLTFEAEVKL